MKFASENGACHSELTRAKNAKTKKDLLHVIHDNIDWVTSNKLFNGASILEYFKESELIESKVGNLGSDNVGLANSGNSNSGNRNSGNSNSGNWNSGNRNSGDSNSGNWNSGNRNSGDSNSGYRNSGAFCTDPNPKLILFDKETDIPVKYWEQSEVVRIMNNIDPTIWIPSSIMTIEEKESHPNWETTEGYLKTISMHDAWANMWGNLPEVKRQLFLDLPNFDAAKFEEITGIKIKSNDN